MTKTDDAANEKYNQKVVSTGSWIDMAFLEQVLSTSLENEVKVIDYHISAAVGAGDNYLSILYKTRVQFTTSESDGQQQELNLMIKGKPESQIFLDMIDSMGLFRKEITMYGECLPAMLRALREYFPKDSPFVAPGSFKCRRENTLVMEDIGGSGYKMANRQNQLDLEHSILSLRTLARFHALSAKVYQQNPEMIKSMASEVYIKENEEKMSQFLEACFTVLALVVDTWGEMARFAPKLRDFAAGAFQILMYVVRPSENFNVLNHGDIWANNIMYKYSDDGALESVKLVDFQMSRYSTPALDLHYFFFTSTQPAILSEHMFELIKIYHQALTSDLATLGLNTDYSLEQLHEDMKNRAAFALLAIGQILPHVVAAPSDVFDLDDIVSEAAAEEHPLMTNFKNPKYQATASSYLELMDTVGYLQDATRANKDPEEVRSSALSRIRSAIRRIISMPVCQ